MKIWKWNELLKNYVSDLGNIYQICYKNKLVYSHFFPFSLVPLRFLLPVPLFLHILDITSSQKPSPPPCQMHSSSHLCSLNCQSPPSASPAACELPDAGPGLPGSSYVSSAKPGAWYTAGAL